MRVVDFYLGGVTLQFLYREWTTNTSLDTRTNKNKGLLVFIFIVLKGRAVSVFCRVS